MDPIGGSHFTPGYKTGARPDEITAIVAGAARAVIPRRLMISPSELKGL